jgi:hypothetical protein
MLSIQLVPLPAAELFLVQETLAPQLLDTVTLPPLAGNDVGEAETVHDGVVVPPLQLIVTLLAVSTLDVQLPPLMVIVRPSEGVGATMQADETAAASTRLTDRNMCMAYLEKRRRLAAMAQRKRCARLSTNSRMFYASPYRIRRAWIGYRQTVTCAARGFLWPPRRALAGASRKKRRDFWSRPGSHGAEFRHQLCRNSSLRRSSP